MGLFPEKELSKQQQEPARSELDGLRQESIAEI